MTGPDQLGDPVLRTVAGYCDEIQRHADPGQRQRLAALISGTAESDAGEAAGLVWLSKRAPNGRAVLLSGDRCDDAVIFSPLGERRLDGAGPDWLNLRLAQLRTRVRR